jgi:hypothetical protein
MSNAFTCKEGLASGRGIAPIRNCTHLLNNVLNIFLCIKLFSYTFAIFTGFIPLVDIIGIKPPVTTNPILRKWVQYRVNWLCS